MLKVCRTPGLTAYLKLLQKVYLKRWRKEKKSTTVPGQPQTYNHLINAQMLTGVCQEDRMFSPCQFHVYVSIGTLVSDSLSLASLQYYLNPVESSAINKSPSIEFNHKKKSHCREFVYSTSFKAHLIQPTLVKITI